MHKRLHKKLVCPLCKGELEHQPKHNEMVCHKDRLAFPIRKGIPVLLEADAMPLLRPLPGD